MDKYAWIEELTDEEAVLHAIACKAWAPGALDYMPPAKRAQVARIEIRAREERLDTGVTFVGGGGWIQRSGVGGCSTP